MTFAMFTHLSLVTFSTFRSEATTDIPFTLTMSGVSYTKWDNVLVNKEPQEMFYFSPEWSCLAQQPMRARAYCAHPSIRGHWALRSISRCPDQVVSLCLSPQASLVDLI
ncbi:hypothetical protein TNCV_4929861 [Trichonephila clavipes]|nr:hypothetical protein TNCV_4929861 [Trichonephila clavipes]